MDKLYTPIFYKKSPEPSKKVLLLIQQFAAAYASYELEGKPSDFISN